MHKLQRILERKLLKRKEDNLYRELPKQSGLIDFFSNDYLGFARSEALYRLIREKVESHSHLNGATGSRLLSGNSPYTEQVERRLSAFFQSESCLIFNSGYSANLAVLSTIPQRGDTLIYDELAHASIKDGARLSVASRMSFRHNDLDDLRNKLQRSKGNVFIVIESVYSMNGDSPNIKDVANLSEEFGATIILDEAHTTGIIGPDGSGFALSENVADKIPLRIYTFGKAMGIHGACVCGSQLFINYIVNYARPFIYTTALPAHSIASIDCAFTYLKKSSDSRTLLDQNIRTYKSLLQEIAMMNLAPNDSPIQNILIPGNEKVKECSALLQKRGLDVRPILSPTVKEGTERLRICLHSYNSQDEITMLVNSIKGLAKD